MELDLNLRVRVHELEAYLSAKVRGHSTIVIFLALTVSCGIGLLQRAAESS